MSNKNKKVNNCSKVKNACKYCLEQVTNKNGLQCQGACQKWAHFKCLNYTPGKISDIKAGVIKVMCPCPDCDTTQVKEFLTNPPYSCTKNKCPANNKGPVKCDKDECPLNKGKKTEKECSNKTCNDTKQPHPRMASARPPTPYQSKAERREARAREVTRFVPINSSDSCVPDCPNRNSNSSSDNENSPKSQAEMVQALKEMCGTVGKLSIQLNDLMGQINKMA